LIGAVAPFMLRRSSKKASRIFTPHHFAISRSAGAAQGSGAGCMQRLASKPAVFAGPSAGNFAAALHPEIAGLC